MWFGQREKVAFSRKTGSWYGWLSRFAEMIRLPIVLNSGIPVALFVPERQEDAIFEAALDMLDSKNVKELEQRLLKKGFWVVVDGVKNKSAILAIQEKKLWGVARDRVLGLSGDGVGKE